MQMWWSMGALPLRLLAFGLCVLGALAYGIWNELEKLPDSLDRAVLVASALLVGVSVAALQRRYGIALFLGAPFLSIVWTAAALGDFVPFALGLDGRVLNNYDYDMAWHVRLTVELVTFAIGGLFAGLISSAIAAGILAVARMLPPGHGHRQPLR